MERFVRILLAITMLCLAALFIIGVIAAAVVLVRYIGGSL